MHNSTFGRTKIRIGCMFVQKPSLDGLDRVQGYAFLVDEEIQAKALGLVHLSLFLKHLNYMLARLGSCRNPDNGKIPADHTLCETTVRL